MTKKKFKNNFKKLRLKAGFSQSELARVMGVSHTAVNKWDSGEVLPRTSKLPMLATVLRCKVSDFF